MDVHCADCDATFLLGPDGVTAKVACPNCGGERLERDQPSPTKSDGELRDMIDSGYDQDMGGNPLMEGTLGDGGWRPWDKRDESYASVKKQAEFDMGDFNFGERTPTHKFVIDQHGKVFSAANPTTHEEIGSTHKLHGFPHKMSLGELYDDGGTDWYQHDTSHSTQALESMLYGHFGQPVQIDPSLKPSTNEERWGIPDPSKYPESTQPGFHDKYVKEQEAVQQRGRPFPHYDNPFFNRGGSVDRSLDMDVYMPWAHAPEVTSSTQKEAFLPLLAPAAMAAGRAFGPALLKKALPKLMGGALMGVGSAGAQGLLGMGGEDPNAAGAMPSAPPRDIDALSHVTADVVTPHGNPGYHDTDDGDTKQFDAESTSTNFDNPTVDGEGGATTGEDNTHGKPFSDDATQRAEMLLPALIHFFNSPDSGITDPQIKALHDQLEAEMPGYLDHDDDDGDVQELLKHLREPSAVASSVKTAQPMMMQQPMMQPGAPQQQQTQQLLNPQQHPTQQTQCMFCGAPTMADGTCPSCGAKAGPFGANPGQNQSMPTSTPAVAPGYTARPVASVTASDHQGPTTDEQKKAVAELLIDSGRHEEIPHMLEAPYDYAEEMAQVANKIDTPTNVDPNEQPPPMPVQEVAPPGATMPVPGMGDPSAPQPGMMASRQAADNLAPRCPRCSSATTGLLGQQGDGTMSARCHACGHVWSENDRIQREKIGADIPNPVAAPAADQQGQPDPSQDTDSSGTWATSDGQPLQPGQQYEIHSANYTIPDIVKVVEVKPDALVVDSIGEYGNDDSGNEPLTYRHEIPREDLELQKLTFEPSGADPHEDSQQTDATDQTPGQPLTSTEPQPTNPTTDQHIGSTEEPDDTGCPKCASEDLNTHMSSATTSFHECFRCGHGWETKEADYVDTNTANREWINQDSGPGGEDFFDEMARARAGSALSGTRNIGDIANRDPRLQAVKERLDENKQQREAGKKYTPRDQREFIDEQGVARNADKLELGGTHYEVRSFVDRGFGRQTDPDAVKDEELFLGI